MTNIDLARAYMSILPLNEQRLHNGTIAKKVFELTEKLKPYYDFQVQEEKKIYAEHPNFDPRIGGCPIKDDDEESQHKAIQETRIVDEALKQISDVEVTDFEFEPFSISEEVLSGISISGKEIGCLKPFIIFE